MSHMLRSSLKRGLARQALGHAAHSQANLPALIALARDIRPNLKSQDRLAQRLGRAAGVVLARPCSGGIVLVARNLREAVTRAGTEDIFSEQAVFYTRILARWGRLGAGFEIWRASFSCHALERFVERGGIDLDRPLIPALDAEGARVLRGVARGALILDDGDCCAPAVAPGLWAGSLDRTELEPDWGLAFDDAATRVPVFSVRTFLGPAEMRPTLWLKWRNDPSLRLGQG